MIGRRELIGSLGLLIAAPAIVKASSLMPVKAIEPGLRFLTLDDWAKMLEHRIERDPSWPNHPADTGIDRVRINLPRDLQWRVYYRGANLTQYA